MTSTSFAVPSPTALAVERPAPIFELLPLISRSFSASFSAISVVASTTLSVGGFLFFPFSFVLPAILYILAPVIVTAQILLSVSVLLPYHLAVWFLQTIYPIYVFVGVACISGVVVGYGARQTVKAIGWVLLGQPGKKTVEFPRVEDTPRQQVRRKSSAKGKRRAVVT